MTLKPPTLPYVSVLRSKGCYVALHHTVGWPLVQRNWATPHVSMLACMCATTLWIMCYIFCSEGHTAVCMKKYKCKGMLDNIFLNFVWKIWRCAIISSNLEPVIRMSHENISAIDFDCRFAPKFEFVLIFKKCMNECSQQICLHSSWALWDKQK